ncbi:hypothetical protein [uncultured Roseivirga sp.]|uniref:hypothetical protein n=1 Tax=uncultured Roseivirga sp. TaxID=543088 RepID=UPI0030DD5482|tara:strand:- start:1557 stop:2201 length:645 start_codon:yes stop_codon:yes gene_type:complete
MSKVVVIGSTHSEKGICTSDMLYKALERIQPKCIFLEASPEKCRQVFKGQLRDNLETKTVKKYLTKYKSDYIPVDLNSLPSREKFQKMMNTFNNNPEYYRVLTEYNYLSGLWGFEFLSSPEGDEKQDYLNFLESDIVRIMGNEELLNMYKEWSSLNDMRENQWISKINEYHSKNEVNITVFLVGSGHRVRLMEKIKNRGLNEKSKPLWNFYYFN